MIDVSKKFDFKVICRITEHVLQIIVIHLVFFTEDEMPQIIIEPGCWYGGYPIHPENKNHDHKPGEKFDDNLDDYVFFGCSCSPSFEFEEFETGDYKELKEFFKERKDILPIIEKLGWRN